MKRIVLAIVAASSFPALSACVATGSGELVVEEDPPPPREEVIVTRPGYIHIEGHWYRRGGRWEWKEGYYERERAGQHWVAGHWDRRGRQRVWVEGRWVR